VKLYASLGNHDAREQRFYKLFNMEGKLYYTFSPRPDVRFFALESTSHAPYQIKWLNAWVKRLWSRLTPFGGRSNRTAIWAELRCGTRVLPER
jgi:hypothetical protein